MGGSASFDAGNVKNSVKSRLFGKYTLDVKQRGTLKFKQKPEMIGKELKGMGNQDENMNKADLIAILVAIRENAKKNKETSTVELTETMLKEIREK